MTKKEFVNELYHRTGKSMNLSKDGTRELLDNVFFILEDLMVKGDKFVVNGFGTFTTRTLKAREGYNLAKGGVVTYPPVRTPKMLFSNDLRKRIKEYDE